MKTAGDHFMSAPQTMTLPPVDHTCAMEAPGFGPFIFFYLSASDGAAETAIAITATAPNSRTLAMDFMGKTPSR